jgi:hypothetical protein
LIHLMTFWLSPILFLPISLLADEVAHEGMIGGATLRFVCCENV